MEKDRAVMVRGSATTRMVGVRGSRWAKVSSILMVRTVMGRMVLPRGMRKATAMGARKGAATGMAMDTAMVIIKAIVTVRCAPLP